MLKKMKKLENKGFEGTHKETTFLTSLQDYESLISTSVEEKYQQEIHL